MHDRIFRIHVLPAQRGDCLIIECGRESRPYRILVDGGVASTGRGALTDFLRRLPPPSHIDLLVVTHIDQDHIEGIVVLLKSHPSLTIGQVWFNGWDQLPAEATEEFGVPQALELSRLLDARYASVWNRSPYADYRGAISLGPTGEPRPIDLAPGVAAIVLAPDRDALRALKRKWAAALAELKGPAGDGGKEAVPPGSELEAMGPRRPDVMRLANSAFHEDDGVPNGSSIAFLLTCWGRRAVFLADAPPTVILRSLKRVFSGCSSASVDCVKVSHHGSRRNTDLPLATFLQSRRWIFSSNGAMTQHPDSESVARILSGSSAAKQLLFNYRTRFNEEWERAVKFPAYPFSAKYGDGENPMCVDLLDEPGG